MHNRSALRPSPVPQVPGQVPSSTMHNTAALRKAIGQYYKELEEYKSIVRLVGQVITVSLDTVRLVNGL